MLCLIQHKDYLGRITTKKLVNLRQDSLGQLWETRYIGYPQVYASGDWIEVSDYGQQKPSWKRIICINKHQRFKF